MPESTDPIGAAQASLLRYAKCAADTLWHVQQLGADAPTRAAELGRALASAAREFEECVAALPDFAQEIGPKASFLGSLREGEARQDALIKTLDAGIAEGGEFV